jgi:hypothetical protein
MPEDEAIKCEFCDEVIAAGVEVRSTSDNDFICGACYSNMWNCSSCNELKHENDDCHSDINGSGFCEDCLENGNYHCCEGCGEYINIDRHEYYASGDTIACSGCADECAFSDCSNCGNTIMLNEVYSEHWENENQCYDCYNSCEEHISNAVSGSGAAANVKITEHYKSLRASKNKDAAKDDIGYFLDWYYRGDAGNYDSTDLYLIKSNKGFGAKYGFYNSEMEIASGTYRSFANFIKDMMQRDVFLVEHKKYGLYHPIRDIFKRCVTYYDKINGGTRAGTDITAQEIGENWLRWPVERINQSAIVEMLQLNKTDDGADLKRALTNVLNRSYKHRVPAHFPEGSRYYTTLEKYRTNATCITLPFQIGFDPVLLQDVARFNDEVGSCQCKANAGSYGFGMIDMAANPHLWLLIYDSSGEYIIGRSVIKFFKEANEWGKEQGTTYIAPSRLYLSEYTQAKAELYSTMFRAVDKWANAVFNDYKLVAHTYSRHDTDVLSYIKSASDFTFSEAEKRLYTQWWLPFWLQKPSERDAEYTYYQDENARIELARTSTENKVSNYAARERLSKSSFRVVEVNKNEF